MHERPEKKLLRGLPALHIESESESETFAFEMCPRDGGEQVERLPPIDIVKRRSDRCVMSQNRGWGDCSSGGSSSNEEHARVGTRNAPRIEKQSSVDDIKCINTNSLMLRTCGYYYEDLSRHEAKEKLRHRKVGTFLLRNSSDPRYLFSLSVKTTRGTTSVRIEYRGGKWRMDCEDRLINQMPAFYNVVALVDFYIKLSHNDINNQCVWLESSGRRDTPVKLLKPARSGVISLQHACRLAINKQTHPGDIEKLCCLPTSLKRFVQEYPYSH